MKDLGFPVAVAGYLLWRDYKFMGGITGLMTRMDSYLDKQQGSTTVQKGA